MANDNNVKIENNDLNSKKHQKSKDPKKPFDYQISRDRPQSEPPVTYQQPFPAPYYTYPIMFKPPKMMKISDISLLLIFLICITVYWLPYIISSIIGMPIYLFNSDLAEIIAGIALIILTFIIMFLIRRNLDNPTLKDYGITSENLGSNLILSFKLIFIFFSIWALVLSIFEFLGISFEGGPAKIDIYFIISAVIIAPIFEETVYRMNASTLLARKLTIIWVAWITSTWFIVKHLPMWFFNDSFGLPALSIIIIVDIPIWTLVTFFYLKRNCIWIPLIVHMFNNGTIVLFHYVPNAIGEIVSIIFFGLGVVFIFIFGIPWIYKKIIKPIKYGRIRISNKTYRNLGLSLGLIALLLITSEALVFLNRIDEIICIPIGFLLLVISFITFIYFLAQSDVQYVKK